MVENVTHGHRDSHWLAALHSDIFSHGALVIGMVLVLMLLVLWWEFRNDYEIVVRGPELTCVTCISFVLFTVWCVLVLNRTLWGGCTWMTIWVILELYLLCTTLLLLHARPFVLLYKTMAINEAKLSFTTKKLGTKTRWNSNTFEEQDKRGKNSLKKRVLGLLYEVFKDPKIRVKVWSLTASVSLLHGITVYLFMFQGQEDLRQGSILECRNVLTPIFVILPYYTTLVTPQLFMCYNIYTNTKSGGDPLGLRASMWWRLVILVAGIGWNTTICVLLLTEAIENDLGVDLICIMSFMYSYIIVFEMGFVTIYRAFRHRKQTRLRAALVGPAKGSLEEFLAHEMYFKAMRDHLVQEMNLEPLKFIVEVEAFNEKWNASARTLSVGAFFGLVGRSKDDAGSKKMNAESNKNLSNEETIEDHAKRIIDEYLRPGSNSEINLPRSVSGKVLGKEFVASHGCFDQIKIAVLDLVQCDSMPRFLAKRENAALWKEFQHKVRELNALTPKSSPESQDSNRSKKSAKVVPY